MIPSFSIDGGLYFDHDASLGEQRVVQTIEPRLYYLRVAHRDQDHLPLFDAGSYTFGYDHMFRENRFSGIDRVGDADRLTLALDSRLLAGGREILEARLGKMKHFRGRRVRLCTTADREPDLDPGRGTDPLGNACRGEEETLDLSRSSWILGLKARPHRSFTIGGSLEHGGDESRHRTVALDLRYHPSAESDHQRRLSTVPGGHDRPRAGTGVRRRGDGVRQPLGASGSRPELASARNRALRAR